MQKRDYYLFKEILLGFRTEYLKMEEKLKQLEKFAKASDKSVENIQFSIYGAKEMNPELTCCFSKKQNEVQRKIHKLRVSLSGYFKSNRSVLVKDNNNHYFMKESNFPVYIENTSHEQFHLLAEEILNSDFAKNMYLQYIQSDGRETNSSINSSPSSFDLRVTSNDEVTRVSYFPYDDILAFIYDNTPISFDLIDYIFNNTKFPREQFNEYQQKAIETNNQIVKPVQIIGSIGSSSMEQFSIDETESSLILTLNK